jgi:hypothetical protein
MNNIDIINGLTSMGYRSLRALKDSNGTMSNVWGKPVGYAFVKFDIENLVIASYFYSPDGSICPYSSVTFNRDQIEKMDILEFIDLIQSFENWNIKFPSQGKKGFAFLDTGEQIENTMCFH